MLEFERVLLCFRQLSGCREDKLSEVVPLVMSAMKEVERKVDPAKLTENDVPACEYAAACGAVYDYVCREAGQDMMTVTAAGTADNSGDISHRIKGAERLKAESLRRIEWLMKGEDFLFKTM
ncbi:hypothetical protein [Ruminococcus sp.]|uniref:hypothetical protein n=1 Tax=Ruminococcus sp. TaxID=41978 RepID=UPI0025CEAAC2|nr:hypothetical protein [Ruminococcus sp.]MBQ8965940.1 hypothetical protein [Ruminococcus sp.]